MPIKKTCTCGARSNKRCPLHSSVPRPRIYQRHGQPPQPPKAEKWWTHVKAISGALSVGGTLLKLIYLIIHWGD